MFDVPLDMDLKIYLENLIYICKFNFMVRLCGSKFLCCVLLAASLGECKGEGDGLRRENRIQQREWGTGLMKRKEFSWAKTKYRNRPVSSQRKEMEGKCLDTKKRRGLDIGDWRF